MSQSLAKLLVHVTFATAGRRRLLDDGFRIDLHKYAMGIMDDKTSPVIAINSVEDHMHVLFNLHKTVALSNAIMHLKRGTSRWLNQHHFKAYPFEWQKGYGAFSVSLSMMETVSSYIRDQRDHHRRKSFEEEFCQRLRLHDLQFDEAYLWDDGENTSQE